MSENLRGPEPQGRLAQPIRLPGDRPSTEPSAAAQPRKRQHAGGTLGRKSRCPMWQAREAGDGAEGARDELPPRDVCSPGWWLPRKLFGVV